MLTIDTGTSLGSRAAGRLDDEIVVWLTTVAPSGTPQPTPVWFYWTGAEFLVFSQPDKAKLRNLTTNPRIAVNFNGTETGGDIQVFTGHAEVDKEGPSADELERYDAKYDDAIKGLGMTRESFHAEYSVLIRIVPDKLRA
jgi:PPOX class probable F420-dependent enzyme